MRLSSALLRTTALLPIALAIAPAHAGLELGTVGGSTLSFEGLLQADAIWFDIDRAALADGTDDRATALRRAELVLKGKGPGRIDWVVGYDARAEKWLDVNLRVGLPLGRLTLGQFKQPNSLEELSSTKNNDFIAKAAATSTFAVARRLGAAWHHGGEDWSVTGSVFNREMTGGGAQGGGYGIRGTWAPVRAEGRLLHVGASWVDHDTDGDQLRLRARPQADLATVRLLDTGRVTDADRVSIAGLESVWVRGPLKLQGELLHADVDRLASPDFQADGGYLSAMWNLTGQTWGYKGGVPATPLPEPGGRGMWQLGARYDRLDLDDGGVQGGRMDALTAGLNWYYGRHLKAMLNLVDVRTERRGVHDDPDMVELRVQLHW